MIWILPYIHLNNCPPNDPKFDEVWEEMTWAQNRGIRVVLMIGGAGGGSGGTKFSSEASGGNIGFDGSDPPVSLGG